MALRKEPERRYPSVGAFANDIENYLGRRVVTAREDSLWYRATRFLQRHARSVIAAAAVALALAAAVISNEYQARRVQRHFEITRSLASDVLLSIDRELSRIPAATEPRRNLIRTVMSTLDRIFADTGNDRRLEAELAVAYERAGGLQSTLPNGEPRQSLERAIELGERVRTNGKPDARLIEALARAYYLLGIRFYELSDLDRARKNLLLAIDRGRDPILPRGNAMLAGAARWLGRMENETGHVGEAVHWMEQAVKAAEASVREVRSPLHMQELTSARSYLARSLSLSGNLVRAAQVADRAAEDGLSIYRTDPGDDEAKLALVSGTVGPASGHAMPSDFAAPMARRENVETAVREAKAMTEVAPTVNYWWTWLVMAYLQQSRTAPDVPSATQAARNALSVAEKQVQVTGATRVTSRNRAFARIQLTECLHCGGHTSEALEQGKVALAELASGPRDRDADVLAVDATLVVASVHEGAGDIADATAAFDRARTNGEALAAADPTDMRTAAFLAMAYEGLGRCSRPGGGADWFRKSVAVWKSWPDQTKAGAYAREHLRQAERWLAAAQQ
jgi:tetratricopeptide (TPR) repeat protein